MDQVLNKVGSDWFSKRASKKIDSIGDDINLQYYNAWMEVKASDLDEENKMLLPAIASMPAIRSRSNGNHDAPNLQVTGIT
ncbi:hypothetical protein GUJ93_ZPchr0004g38827 [Zizania palustris]|uniref:Uncharacterized protein n=1 Tax=Zizania palustris TaxID=103762 RepID=A0A8J5SJH3_ZIZPA|nr:hypothetical protein GUJ93_ZPchr0004g38827 [Zizania palustris]